MTEKDCQIIERIKQDLADEGYEVQAHIGGGGFVDVYRASKDGQIYAIKSCKDHNSDSKKLDKDYDITNQLNPDFFITPVERFSINDSLYIVFHYAESTLAKKIKVENGLKAEEVFRLTRAMCFALLELEKQNIVHRDIKPANILHGLDGRYRLNDFGLAQHSGDSEGRQSFSSNASPHPGTLGYKSPEQSTSTGLLYPSSDIYSMGCVIFEALTGEKYKNHLGDKPRNLGVNIPRWFESVLKKCLLEKPCLPNRNPRRNQRYSSAKQILEVLDKYDPQPIEKITDNATLQKLPEPGAVWIARREFADSISLDNEQKILLSRIPAGDFVMGSDEQDPDVVNHETPRRIESLGEYLISVYPITVGIYRYFLTDVGDFNRLALLPEGREDHPVCDVTWFEANKFCIWASNATHRQIRLPSEQEWEKAARGEHGNPYPWGDVLPSNDHCNFNNYVGDTTPVGSYSPLSDSVYHCVDMAGNVWEWTSNDEDGNESGLITNPWEFPSKSVIIRGGAIPSNWKEVRSTCRRSAAPSGQGWKYIGFRIVVEA